MSAAGRPITKTHSVIAAFTGIWAASTTASTAPQSAINSAH